MRGGDGDAASIIDVLLSKHSTGCSHMRVNGREHRVWEKACQSNILWGQHEQKIGSYALIELSQDK
jgi:hypothetical protein